MTSEAESQCLAVLARCEEGELSLPIAVMEMLIALPDETRVADLLRAQAVLSPRAQAAAELLEKNASGCARVAAMLRSDKDAPPKEGTVEDGIAYCRSLFDWSVRQSEEASVALYSLGNPALLRSATAEIVELFARWGILDRGRRALDIGCGIGRMEEALAPRLSAITGIDVSAEMVRVARRRCAQHGNVVIDQCSGIDLAGWGEAAFDLVFAVDSFPYLVQSGMALVERHFADAARVLRPRGDFVILNLSYRDDYQADCRDVEALAAAHGLVPLVNGDRPFALWNGIAFRMVRE